VVNLLAEDKVDPYDEYAEAIGGRGSTRPRGVPHSEHELELKSMKSTHISGGER
jgi:hypothetical protein